MVLSKVPIRVGHEHACPYLDERLARSAWVDPQLRLSQPLYTALAEAGFRRSGELVYRPDCAACRECIPVRVPVAEFVPNRSQRRVWRSNADVSVEILPPVFRQEQYALFLRYQALRHPGSAMAGVGPDEYLEFLRSSWLPTRFLEFRRDQDLVAVAVVDMLDDALSAVYTFYDPVRTRSGPGVHAVLHQIRWGAQLGMRWCYLGYWISGSRKMAYKRQFRPIEGRVAGHWRRLD